MIKIIDGKFIGPQTQPLSYIKNKNFLSRIILFITRYLRAKQAMKFMARGRRHLDIGCGDAYLLKKSPFKEKYGLDRVFGDEIKNHIDCPNGYFDCVTMLAVLEHLADPRPLFEEVSRILAPNGYFIITTPKKNAEFLIRLYSKDVSQDHQTYFDYKKIKELSDGFFDAIVYKTFIFGLNQVFCLRKK